MTASIDCHFYDFDIKFYLLKLAVGSIFKPYHTEWNCLIVLLKSSNHKSLNNSIVVSLKLKGFATKCNFGYSKLGSYLCMPAT